MEVAQRVLLVRKANSLPVLAFLYRTKRARTVLLILLRRTRWSDSTPACRCAMDTNSSSSTMTTVPFYMPEAHHIPCWSQVRHWP